MKQQVVIVGGGLAGLSAAEALARNASDELRITVLDAKRIAGGRAGSFIDSSTGESVDYCQHAAMGCCTNLLGLLRRCGLDDAMRRYSSLRFLHPDHPPSHFEPSRWLPPPLHLARTIDSLTYLNRRDKREIRRGLFRLMRVDSDSLRHVSAGTWLQDNGQSVSAIEKFWDVILVSALGESTQVVSMAAARKVMIDGFAAARGASDVLIPTQPLNELFGQRLAMAISNLGVDLKCSKRVTRITTRGVGAIVQTADDQFQADHVVVAVPWHRLGPLLSTLDTKMLTPELDLDAIGQIPSSPITGIHFWFDRPITEHDHAVMVGTRAQWVFRDPTSVDQDKTDEHYYQVVISASRERGAMVKSELVDCVFAELRHAFPAARDASIVRSRVVTDPHSVFSLRCDVDAIRPPSATGASWLHLAGDWIQTGWPATMEGAVISGRMAAQSVFKSLGTPVDTLIDSGLHRGWLARWLIKP